MLSKSAILRLQSLNEEVYRMDLAKPEGFSALPGQFIQMKIEGDDYPLLRRPISLYDVTADSIVLYIKRAGMLTRRMADLIPGSMIDFIGPLGTPFTTNGLEGRTPVLVGGGIGIAPVAFLAKQLEAEGVFYQSLLGYKTMPYGEEAFRSDSLTVHVESIQQGYVTDVLQELFIKNQQLYLFACGPTPMLKTVKRLATQYHVPAQISLEERMACGVGACVGCSVRCTDGLSFSYKRVCKEGPVFKAEEVLWDE